MVPFLVLVFSVDTPIAIGTSLTMVVFSSLSSTVAYLKKEVINLKLAKFLIPATFSGVWFGAVSTDHLPSATLSFLFGILLLYPSILMILGMRPAEIANIFGKKKKNIEGIDELPSGDINPSPLKTVMIGLAAGYISGLLGVGGGVLMVPAMVFILKIPIIIAVATSLMVMGPSAGLGAYTHYTLGNLDYKIVIPLILGVMIGAQIGPRIAVRLPGKRIRQAFGLLLGYASIRMIMSFF